VSRITEYWCVPAPEHFHYIEPKFCIVSETLILNYTLFVKNLFEFLSFHTGFWFVGLSYDFAVSLG